MTNPEQETTVVGDVTGGGAKCADGPASVEHLAKVIWLNGWTSGNFAMLTACFDASGHATQQAVVVAGFVASVSDWMDFDRRWVARLSEDCLPYFHMRQFAQSDGMFIEWKDNERRRRALLSDLYDIILSHVYRKFGTAIVNSELAQAVPESEQRTFRTTAFGLAGRGVVANVLQWASAEHFGPVEFVFEDGDLDNGHLTMLMQADGLPAPIFKPKCNRVTKYDLPVSGFTPLQAADILAYEYRLVLNRDASVPVRWGYEQFDKVPGEIGRYTVGDLQRIKAAKIDGEVR